MADVRFSVPWRRISLCAVLSPVSGNYGIDNPHSGTLYVIIATSETQSSSLPQVYVDGVRLSSDSHLLCDGYRYQFYGSVSACAPSKFSSNIYLYYGDSIMGMSTYDFESTVTTSYDLLLGDVAPYSMSISDGYATWALDGIDVEDAGSETGTSTYYPVSITESEEAAQSMTQAEAQAGTYTGTIEDMETGTDTESGTITDATVATTPWATFTEWVSAGWADLKAAVVAIPQSVADTFTPSAELNTYTLELKDFFPFCIPYDLYSLFNAFSAEPMTPYWELEFNFGDLGTFPFTVDLSVLDDVAEIARTFEVVCFCILLAFGTKKLLGW